MSAKTLGIPSSLRSDRRSKHACWKSIQESILSCVTTRTSAQESTWAVEQLKTEGTDIVLPLAIDNVPLLASASLYSLTFLSHLRLHPNCLRSLPETPINQSLAYTVDPFGTRSASITYYFVTRPFKSILSTVIASTWSFDT
jgi:hypothetical protein